jgi:hypothetical protein
VLHPAPEVNGEACQRVSQCGDRSPDPQVAAEIEAHRVGPAAQDLGGPLAGSLPAQPERDVSQRQAQRERRSPGIACARSAVTPIASVASARWCRQRRRARARAGGVGGCCALGSREGGHEKRAHGSRRAPSRDATRRRSVLRRVAVAVPGPVTPVLKSLSAVTSSKPRSAPGSRNRPAELPARQSGHRHRRWQWPRPRRSRRSRC